MPYFRGSQCIIYKGKSWFCAVYRRLSYFRGFERFIDRNSDIMYRYDIRISNCRIKYARIIEI